jgi:ribosomal protein L40E
MKPKMICSTCSTPLPPDARFCPKCGASIDTPEGTTEKRITVDCKTCGAIVPAGSVNCPECGASLRLKDRKTTPASSKTSKEHSLYDLLSSWKVTAVIAVLLLIIVYLILKKNDAVEHPTSGAQPTAPAIVQPGASSNTNIQQYERQLSTNPDNHALRLEYANFLHDEGMFQQAVAQYAMYLKSHETDVDARVDMAICQNELGQIDVAIREIEKALGYNPNHSLAHFNLGIILIKKGDITRAKSELQRVITLAPGTPTAQHAQELIKQH